MRTIPPKLHAFAHSVIDKAPAYNLFLFRAYNKTLQYAAPFEAKTYFGARMICDPHDLIDSCILHYGIWEPTISRTIVRILQDGDIAVDVGANIGYDTLLASTAVGDAGAVVAIEASPSIFGILSQNLALNRVTNVRAVNKAVSDRRHELPIYAGPKGNRGQTTTVQSRNLRFEANTEALPLDEILTADEIARVKLIKIDIEGGELPVMTRFIETVGLYPDFVKILVEVSPAPEWQAVFDRMLGLGFGAYALENSYDRTWYIKNRDKAYPAKRIESLPDTQTDILFSRDAVALN
jgi:FkbM family methyltransferase